MKYLSHNELISKLSEQEMNDLMRQGTSVRPNDVLQKAVTKLKPEIKNIVEIGTWRGVSSLVMASCENVDTVYTFDINPSYFPEKLWEKFGLRGKIVHVILPNSFEIYKAIEKLDFDFTYIDGSHKTEEETRDFLVMKLFSDKILIDDTDDDRVFGIVSPYGAKKISFRFAVWMKNNDYSIVDEIKKDLEWDEPYGKMDFRHLERK